MKTFRVYFRNGNQKLYETYNIFSLVKYLENNLVGDIVKIEEV